MKKHCHLLFLYKDLGLTAYAGCPMKADGSHRVVTALRRTGDFMNYQYVIVGALGVISAMTVVLAGPVMSFFIPVMHSDVGIPLVYFGIAMSMRQLGFAFASPFIGKWIDQYGARRILLFVGVCSGVIVWSLGSVTESWHLVLLIGLLGLMGLQGAGGELYASVVVAKWFQENRGRAMSLVFLGMPLGILVFTPLIQYMIDTLGWQNTWQISGLAGAIVFLVAASLIKQPPPAKETGAHLSDAAVSEKVSTPGVQKVEHHWTRAEAVRSPAFWKLAIGFGIMMFTVGTVVLFRVPHFIDQGLDAQWVAFGFGLEGIVSAAAAIPVGMLMDRYRLHQLGAFAFSLVIVMLLLVLHADNYVVLALSMIVFGLGASSVMILQNTIWPAYFGTNHIGAIRGAAMPVTLGLAMLGAPIAGWVGDLTGSFAPLWWVCVGLMVVAIGLVATTPKPDAVRAEKDAVPAPAHS